MSQLTNWLTAMVVLLALASCSSRPTAKTLEPINLSTPPTQTVSVLSATNREYSAGKVVGNTWASKLTFEQYQFSVPTIRKGVAIVYPTSGPKPDRQYIVTARRELSQPMLINSVAKSADADGTVGIFVHGYNNSYQEALFRMAQMVADAKLSSSPILFSWPSMASVTGYVADRDAMLASRRELSSLVELVAGAPHVKRIVLFGHSMGGFLTMETLRDLKLRNRDEILRKLVVILAAPDIDFDVFRAQLLDVGKMQTPITIMVSKVDRALSVSSFIAGDRGRVGRVDINNPEVGEAVRVLGVRVIDISSVEGPDGLGHDRYVSLAQFGNDFIIAENNRISAASVGTFVFDTAGAVMATPFRLASEAVSH